jgi:exosome complex component CSL4
MSAEPKVFPGDRLAVSEEYFPGAHTFDDGGIIRSLALGAAKHERGEVSVTPASPAKVLAIGDYVTGQVEVAQSSSAGVRIYYSNGRPFEKDFSGSIVTRSGPPGRGRRDTPPVRLGDIVRCRVFSLMNGMIHLSINEPDAGVLYALCDNCGRPLLRAGGNRLKCDECGNVEDRKLASDFGQTPIQP